jgi:hypothetical protein
MTHDKAEEVWVAAFAASCAEQDRSGDGVAAAVAVVAEALEASRAQGVREMRDAAASSWAPGIVYSAHTAQSFVDMCASRLLSSAPEVTSPVLPSSGDVTPDKLAGLREIKEAVDELERNILEHWRIMQPDMNPHFTSTERARELAEEEAAGLYPGMPPAPKAGGEGR